MFVMKVTIAAVLVVLTSTTGIVAADDTVSRFAASLQAKRADQANLILADQVEVQLAGACGAKRDELARCLVGLDAAGPSVHFGSGSGALLFRGGLAIGVTVKDRKITRVGYVDTDKADATTPTVFRAANVIERSFKPSSELTATIDARADHRATAVVKACLDAKGKVTRTRLVAASGIADFDEAAKQLVGDYAFAPVEVFGSARAVCEVVRLAVDTRPTAAPPDATRPPNVAPQMLALVKGTRDVVPDDHTKISIRKANKENLIGTWRMCIDETGAVTEVERLKSTGFPGYDLKIGNSVKTWKYKPYLYDGKPQAVCTALSFIYRSRSTTPVSP